MIKYITLISLLILSILQGDTGLDITKLSQNNSSLEHLYCIEDKNDSLNFQDIINSTELQKVTKSNLGYNFNSYWCKLKVHNSSTIKKDFVFYNPRPGVDFIDINIYQNDKIRSLEMGDMRALKSRDLDSIYSNFTLSLDPNETVSIVTKYQTLGNIEIDWKISDIKDFITLQNINFTLIFLYIGFMAAIMFSKVFTYYYIKDKLYLIYAIFVFSAIITNGSNIGTMHYFFSSYIDTFTITMLGSIFSHVFLASLWIFTYYFFLINKKVVSFTLLFL